MADVRPDGEIIRASLSDPDEFGEIYARHRRAVFRYVARRIGSQDAGDVTADAFVRAFSIRTRYDASQTNSLPWLYGIARNIVGDRIRRTRRRKRTYIALVDQGDGEISDADDRLVAYQVTRSLNSALRKLSSRDRETLLLFALEGLTYAEISRVLDIPAGTVGSRITRARRRILELIPDLEQISSTEGPAEHKDEQ